MVISVPVLVSDYIKYKVCERELCFFWGLHGLQFIFGVLSFEARGSMVGDAFCNLFATHKAVEARSAVISPSCFYEIILEEGENLPL